MKEHEMVINHVHQINHRSYGFGNPDVMTPFERSLKAKEEAERHEAKRRYVEGIQGVDGGHCPKY